MSSQMGRWLAAWSVTFAVVSGVGAQQRPVRLDLEARPWTPAEFVAKLAQVAHIDKPYDGPLESIVQSLADQLGVTILYDDVAFKNADPPLDNVQTTTVRLPVMNNVRVETIFRKLLDPLGGTVLIRGDHLHLSSKKEAYRQSGHGPVLSVNDEDCDETVVESWPPFRESPIVHCHFQHQSLRETVAELARRYPEFPIQLSPRVGVRDRTPISGTLVNLPLGDVCQQIARAAGLDAVDNANGMIITTSQHAAQLHRQQEERQRQILLARIRESLPAQPFNQFQNSPKRPKAIDWNDYSRRIRNRQSVPADGE